MKKKKKNEKQRTAQEFVNVEDIDDGILYSRDGYLFMYLKIRAGDSKLLSDEERNAHITSLTSALESEKMPWQLLSIPRTIDTLGMLDYLTQLRRGVTEDARLKLLNGEITALQDMAAEGTKEPVIILKCWQKAARGADKELRKRIRDIRARISEHRVSAEELGTLEITYICKLFSDLSVYQDVNEQFSGDIPLLPQEERKFTNREKDAQNQDLLNLITPIGGLMFGVSRVVVGEVTGRIYAAVRFPSEIDYNWAVDFMNASDCITSITYVPGNASELGNALSRSVRRAATDADSESDARRRKRFEHQAKDADRLIEEMDYQNAAIGHITLLVMPFTSNEEHLDDVCRICVNRFARRKIKLKALGNLQKAAYKHISPYYINQPEVDTMVKHIMPLRTLIGGEPMIVNIFRDDKGCYFARTMDGGIISLDMLYRGGDRTNGNIVCTGMAGRGKSTALKHLVESLYMSGVKIIIIDPEREFRDLCRNLHGTWLDAGGGEAKINPLQIRPAPEDEDEDDPLYRSNDNAMALHMRTLEVFLRLYIPSLTDLQRALMKHSLIDLYAKFHLTWDTDVSNLTNEQFPTFSDFVQLLEERGKKEAQYQELSTLFYDVAKGADSYLWDGHTNVDPQNDFLCFDTNRMIDAGDEVKRAQYFNILTLCWQIMSADRGQPVFLLCDEAHIMLDPDIPQSAMFLRNVAKRCRKYEGMLAIVTQSIADALQERVKPYGQAILDNAVYKILFGTDGRNLQETAELFALTEAEQNILLAGERGKALFLCGSQRMQIDFDIPKYKLELMGKGGGR